MVLHPQVLKKAHEEIDRVVGPKRLPDFEDRENLPYIEAIFQEVLRYEVTSVSSAKLIPYVDDPRFACLGGVLWFLSVSRKTAHVTLWNVDNDRRLIVCVSPPLAGIPHSTMQDDTFNGMFIPKGTMVFANAWYVGAGVSP